MLNKIIPTVMVISGLLTLTMLQALFAPDAAMQSLFNESPDGALRDILVRNWGVLIGLMGALLIYGAFHKPSRSLALVLSSVSKLSFVALVLSQGDRYLAGMTVPVAVDSVMIILFLIFLFVGARTRAA
ncbi:MAG: hypothetical protein NW206_01910 [Hyphomonadaceae bacterium]|nr:hypothetical protein [Hyphomonadaceae bacterium]